MLSTPSRFYKVTSMKGQDSDCVSLSLSLVVTDDCNEFFFLSLLSRLVATKASAEDGKAHAIQKHRVYQVVAVFFSNFLPF